MQTHVPPAAGTGCAPPGRFPCPERAASVWGNVPVLNDCLVSHSRASSCCRSFSFPLPPKTKFSFLSLSFQPCTVAVSSFQPSSAAPTSWLTHFCSEVTGFLADFQRVGLTNPYAAFRTVLPPRSWLCSLQVSCVLTTPRGALGANSAGWCSAPKLFPIPLTWEPAARPRQVHARLPLPLCSLRACFAGCTDRAKPLTFLRVSSDGETVP